jgi:hypothetical protein
MRKKLILTDIAEMAEMVKVLWNDGDQAVG